MVVAVVVVVAAGGGDGCGCCGCDSSETLHRTVFPVYHSSLFLFEPVCHLTFKHLTGLPGKRGTL